MKTSTLVVLAAAGALTLPSTGLGKELASARICGASGCTTITEKGKLRELESSSDSASGLPPAPAGFYRVTTTVKAGPGESFQDGKTTMSWSNYYVLGAGRMRIVDEYGSTRWFRIGDRPLAVLRTAARTIGPFPKPTVTGARVGSKVAGDPQSYLRLWSMPTSGTPTVDGSDWIPITLRSRRPTPWTDGPATLRYSPSKHALERDGEYIRLSSGLAARLERGTSLRASDASFPRLLIVLPLAGAALVGLGGLALGRRRSRLARRLA